MDNICCKNCEHHGMKTATTQYTGHTCAIEPHVGEFDPIYGEKRIYSIEKKSY